MTSGKLGQAELTLLGISSRTLASTATLFGGDEDRAVRELLEGIVLNERRSFAVRKRAAAYLIRLESTDAMRSSWQQTIHLFELQELDLAGVVEAHAAGGNPNCYGCATVLGQLVGVRSDAWFAKLPPLDCPRLLAGEACAVQLVKYADSPEGSH
jgi:hypothetical protein